MDPDTSQTKLSGLAGLRERHQAEAERAARTGVIPLLFVGDPTFAQLVAQLKQEAA